MAKNLVNKYVYKIFSLFVHFVPYTTKMEDGKKSLKKLGARIASLRKKKNISQTDLGVLCNLDRQSMWRIEAGRTNPTYLTLLKICTALEISPKTLMDFE